MQIKKAKSTKILPLTLHAIIRNVLSGGLLKSAWEAGIMNSLSCRPVKPVRIFAAKAIKKDGQRLSKAAARLFYTSRYLLSAAFQTQKAKSRNPNPRSFRLYQTALSAAFPFRFMGHPAASLQAVPAGPVSFRQQRITGAS